MVEHNPFTPSAGDSWMCAGRVISACATASEAFFPINDVLRPNHCHTSSAVAVTPVELARVERWQFLHLHPTIALTLLAQQHQRLREQRASGSFCF